MRVTSNNETGHKWQPPPSMTWLTVIKLLFSTFCSVFPNLLTANKKPQHTTPQRARPQGVASRADTYKQSVETRPWTR